MRISRLLPVSVFAFVLLAAGPVHAGKLAFAEDRFSLEVPADWKKADGPKDGNILHLESPEGDGTFSVFTLAIQKDHRASLAGTLKNRVEAITKSGLTVKGEVEGQEGNVDGKTALFAVVPVEAKVGDETVRFRYNLVFIDAVDTVVILQATLASPAPADLQKAALGMIMSLAEKKKAK